MNPEFSRPIRIDQIPVAGIERELVAEPDERQALAERFAIPAVDSLSARVRIKALRGGTLYLLSGTLVADLTRTCVVTLEPMPEHVEESFEITYSAQAGDEFDMADAEFEMSADEDVPEPLVGGTIDMGEAVAEHLALALDPFPRKPGAAIPGRFAPPEEVEAKPSPFAALAKLRQKKE